MKIHILFPYLTVILASFSLVQSLPGAERVALVVGNDRYEHITQLGNPIRDAEAVGKRLKAGGYEVQVVKDASARELRRAVAKFTEDGKGASQAVVFFAGHGLEVSGKNYLVPVDAKLEEKGDLDLETVSLEWTLKQMEAAEMRLKMVVLDCCRNNPFPTRGWVRTRSQGGGLAKVDEMPMGTMLVYSGEPGKVVPDGFGDHSPFTKAFLTVLDERGGEPITQVFGEVSGRVRAGGAPWLKFDGKGESFAAFTRTAFLPLGKRRGQGGAQPVVPKVQRGRFGGDSLIGAHGMSMRWCPPGTFRMGSPEDEAGRDDDEVAHQVELTTGFWLGKTEVTQGQWEAVMGRNQQDQVDLLLRDPTDYIIGEKEQTLRKHYEGWYGQDYEQHLKGFVGGKDHPVWAVNWHEAVDFCERLTARERAAGRLGEAWCFRLPSEAEWEYACRAGTIAATPAGDLTIKGRNHAPELDAISWYAGNSSEGYPKGKGQRADWGEKQYPGGYAGPRQVGQKGANSWGARDMIGNVSEWSGDFYAGYPSAKTVDPSGPTTGRSRVCRGGSWRAGVWLCRAARRSKSTPSFRDHDLGFRVCLAGPQE